jgi:hypothetical protein
LLLLSLQLLHLTWCLQRRLLLPTWLRWLLLLLLLLLEVLLLLLLGLLPLLLQRHSPRLLLLLLLLLLLGLLPLLLLLLLLLLLWVLLPRLTLWLSAAALKQLLHVFGSIHPAAPNPDSRMQQLPPKDPQLPRQPLVSNAAVRRHPGHVPL